MPLQLLAMGVRRQQMLNHIMDGAPPALCFCIYVFVMRLSFCGCAPSIMQLPLGPAMMPNPNPNPTPAAGSDKGPERRAKVTLSAPLDTPQPPPLTSASEIALAAVIKDVLKRIEQSSEMQRNNDGAAKASMSLYRVPSATERRE